MNDISLVHKICEFYKKVYLLSPKLPKKDRFGIYLKIETICLEILLLVLEASFETRVSKLPILNKTRVRIEILKRLFGVLRELNLITDKIYISTEMDLQEISKMTNGWIKSLK